MGVENGIFWSEIVSGFGEPDGTPLPSIPRSTPPPPGFLHHFSVSLLITLYQLINRFIIYLSFINFVTVNDSVLARRTNNLYYAGKVSSFGNDQTTVLFDDRSKAIYSSRDISATIPDEEPHQVQLGQHVVATWQGGNKYFIGYVSEKDSNNHFKVSFDDNNEGFYDAKQLRLFPGHQSVHSGK